MILLTVMTALKAQRSADSYELAAGQRLTEGQIRRILSELYEQISGAPPASSTVRGFLDAWVDRKRVENSDRTC
jgi:hypothetical protein